MALLRKTFPGIPEMSLGSLVLPTITYVKRLKKGHLPVLPQVMLDQKETVYVNQHITTKWGRKTIHWIIDDTSRISSLSTFDAYITRLNSVVTVPHFAKLSTAEIKKYKLKLRPEWTELKPYMEKVLADPANIEALKVIVGTFKYRLPLSSWRGDTAKGLLENMVHIANTDTAMYNTIKPVLERYKLHDTITEVLTNSKTEQEDKMELVTVYKNLATMLNLKINVPEFDAPTIEVNSMFPKATEIPYRVYCDMWKYAPNRLPAILNQLLKKG